MNKTGIFLIIILILAILIIIFWRTKNQNLTALKINNVDIEIEIAKTPSEKEKGLSGREKLEENSGMLFIFNRPDFYSFWMKDMQFSIDIIWIDENLKIVDISQNLSPQTFPQNFKPATPSQYVLEVNAGFCRQHQIKVGDKVNFL